MKNKKAQVSVGIGAMILAGIIALFGMFSKDKGMRMRARNIGLGVFGVALIGMFVLSGPSGAFFQQPLGDLLGGKSLAVGEGEEEERIESGLGVCPPGVSVEDTTVSLFATDSFTGNSISSTHSYRLNDGAIRFVSDGGSFQASPGNSLEILWHNTTETIPSDSYFSVLETVNVPCRGIFDVQKSLARNGTFSFDIFDRNTGNDITDDLATGPTANQSFVAGDVFTLNSRIAGQFERSFATGGIMVVEFNTSQFDDVIVDFGNPTPISNPTFYTIGVTTNKVKTYEIPALIGSSPTSSPPGEIDGVIIFDADDNQDPQTGDASVGDRVTFTFYPKDCYRDNNIGGKWICDAVEDEDDIALRGGIQHNVYPA